MLENDIISQIREEWIDNDLEKSLLGQEYQDSSRFDYHQVQEVLPRTDLKTVQFLGRILKDRLAYEPSTDTWYAWDGMVHRPLDSPTLIYMIVSEFHERYSAALKWVKWHRDMRIQYFKNHTGDDPKEIEKIKKEYSNGFKQWRLFRDRLASQTGLNAVVKMLQPTLSISKEHFSDDQDWLVIRDGVIDLQKLRETGEVEILPHDASRPVWRMMDIEYDPKATHEALDQLLYGHGGFEASVKDRGQADYLSKAVAVAMLGDIQDRKKKIVSIQGKTNSGKSVFLSAMKKLAGSYYRDGGHDAVVKDPRGNAEHARWNIHNGRIIGLSEVRKSLDEDFILTYTGGELSDTFTISQKYQVGKEVSATGIFFIANNTPLALDKADPAIFARIATIEFPHTYGVGGLAEDRTLGARLQAEASGFLNWLLDSYKLYLKDGLERTDSMTENLSAERSESDTITDFIGFALKYGVLVEDDRPAARSVVVGKILYPIYVEFMESVRRDSRNAVNKYGFAKAIEDVGLEVVISKGTKVLRGYGVGTKSIWQASEMEKTDPGELDPLKIKKMDNGGMKLQ